jgi:type I restriction enzyme M protein
VRAHLLGGVPRAEVEARGDLFAALGLDPGAVFADAAGPPGPGYLAFHPALAERGDLKARVEADPGVHACAGRLREAFAAWWQAKAPRLADLAPRPADDGQETGRREDLLAVRGDLLESFEAALLPVGLLDRFQVRGTVAAWWDEINYDLRTLAAQGFLGLVDSWIASLRASADDGAGRNGRDPLDHPLVERLLPGYLDRLEALAARDAELRAEIAEGKRLQEYDEAEEDEVPSDEALTEMRRERRQVRKEHGALQADFLSRLETARLEVGAAEARSLVLEIERERLVAELARYALAKRQALIKAMETWWDKYRVSLRELETEREVAAERLDEYIRKLHYGH